MPPALSRDDVKAAVLQALQEREDAAERAKARAKSRADKKTLALLCYIRNPSDSFCPRPITDFKRPIMDIHIAASALAQAYEEACANRPVPQRAAGCEPLYKDMWATLRLADEGRLTRLTRSTLTVGSPDYQKLRGCLDEKSTNTLSWCYWDRLKRSLPPEE